MVWEISLSSIQGAFDSYTWLAFFWLPFNRSRWYLSIVTGWWPPWELPRWRIQIPGIDSWHGEIWNFIIAALTLISKYKKKKTLISILTLQFVLGYGLRLQLRLVALYWQRCTGKRYSIPVWYFIATVIGLLKRLLKAYLRGIPYYK